MRLSENEIAELAESPCLVTGASGFIGSTCLNTLTNAGLHPRALVRTQNRALAQKFPHAQQMKGSLATAMAALEDVGTVFNFAYDMRSSGTRNLEMFETFLQAAIRANVQTFVHASSVVVHDNWTTETIHETAPISDTGETQSYRGAKRRMEHLLAAAVARGDIPRGIILRPTLVYGPGSWMWTDAIVRRLRQGPVILPDAPKQFRFGLAHTLHADDLCMFAAKAAADTNEGLGIFLLSDPDPLTWKAFYQAHIDALGTGQLELRPFAELNTQIPPAQPETLPQKASLATRASSALRTIIGSARVDALAARARALRPAPAGPVMPDRFLFDLYCTTGRIDISAAENAYDFKPAHSVEDRVAQMSDYLRTL